MRNSTGLQQLIAGEEAKRRRTATVIAILPQGRAVEMTTLYEPATMSTSNKVLSAAVIAFFLWLAIWVVR